MSDRGGQLVHDADITLGEIGGRDANWDECPDCGVDVRIDMDECWDCGADMEACR